MEGLSCRQVLTKVTKYDRTPTSVQASAVWEGSTWSRQSHPSAFFELCLNITCNCIPDHVSTFLLDDSCHLGVLLSVDIFFLTLGFITASEISRRIWYWQIWLFEMLKATKRIFFGNIGKWNQVEVKGILSNLNSCIFFFLLASNYRERSLFIYFRFV